jgi:AraC-like DNA-binding protein
MILEETPDADAAKEGKGWTDKPSEEGKTDEKMSDDSKWQALMADIDTHVRKNRCHLKPRFALIDLSLEVSQPQYLISKAINKVTGVSFSVWMNRIRIEHFLDLVRREGLKDYSLYIHGMRSGFHSKASFINAFKKEKGSTPGVYVKAMLSQNGDGNEPGSVV